MSAFKLFTLYDGHCDSSSFFQLKKHAAKQFKQNLCSQTLLLAFSISVINIIQFYCRWNIIRFYVRELFTQSKTKEKHILFIK